MRIIKSYAGQFIRGVIHPPQNRKAIRFRWNLRQTSGIRLIVDTDTTLVVTDEPDLLPLNCLFGVRLRQ